MIDLRIINVGDPVALSDAPAGHFIHQGNIGFKTAYGAMVGEQKSTTVEWRLTNRPDAYNRKGEYFFGGAATPDERDALIVQPIMLMVPNAD